MYQISKKANSISKIKEASFSSLNYTERAHLQEWIADTPNIFWEDLLIIQKEFDGFSDTRERLDLLALDLEWNLVIIENKLDDTGRDVVWQSLKYASYCSTLRKAEIIDIYQSYLDKYDSWKIAVKEIENFFDTSDLEDIEFNRTQSQRIIMVAWNFRKEVTSTALWLMNYWLRLQCFKATVFVQWDEHLLNIDQIIPIPDAEEFTISMATKNAEVAHNNTQKRSRHDIRTKFWTKLLPVSNDKLDLFSGVSPSKEPWLAKWAWKSWLRYVYVSTRSYCRIELYSQRATKEDNQKVYDYLIKHKDSIEKNFWDKLVWEDLPSKKAIRISYQLDWVSIYIEEDHQKIINFLTDSMVKFYPAISTYVDKL